MKKNNIKFVPILETFTLINMVYFDSVVMSFVELYSLFPLQKADIKVNLYCEFDVVSILNNIEIGG